LSRAGRFEKAIVTDEKINPGFDEQTLAMLLEAAYVLQEQGQQSPTAKPNLVLQNDPHPTQQAPPPSPPAPPSEPPTREAAPSLSTSPLAESSLLPPSPAQGFTTETFLPEPSPAKSSSPASVSKDDYTFTLAQIVGTQDQIRLRRLDLENTISLVAERLTEIAKAGGAGIALLDGLKARYRGSAGLMTLPPGTELPVEKALCVACLRAGQVIRCSNLNSEFLLDVDACRRRGIHAIIAVPIYHSGKVAGALELYFATTQAFTDQDVHTCQLMAGLITEALAREEEVDWKNSAASERALMLETLEKLKPGLAALAEAPADKSGGGRNSVPAVASSAPKFICRTCGHQLMGEEQFCGSCGAPRSADPPTQRRADYLPPSMKSEAASLWHMQEALKKIATAAPAAGELGREFTISDVVADEKPLADSIEEEMPELFASPEMRIARMSPPPDVPEHVEDFAIPAIGARSTEPPRHELRISLAASEDVDVGDAKPRNQTQQNSDEQEEKLEPAAAIALAHPAAVPNWSSAITAREFLETLAAAKQPGGLARFWQARRGDIYLAIAVIFVAAVIRWGIWSNHSVSATGTPTAATAGHRKPAPDSDLSTFDRMLISLGLAEAPPVPEYKGNPDTQVWIDLHTALYYCPGTDLYGKTPKGKFETQRDAQLDQFEPAYRKACD
jgi:GAF domain-containing protein